MPGPDIDSIDLPSDLAELACRLVAEQGPLHLGELAAALAATGADIGEPRSALGQLLLSDAMAGVAPMADGRYAWLPAVLEGRVFTHRLTDPEVEHSFLTLVPDLHPLWGLTDLEHYQRLADGTPFRYADPIDSVDELEAMGIQAGVLPVGGVFLLDPKVLGEANLAAGDTVALRVTPAGLDLTALPAGELGDPPADLDGLLTAVLREALEPDLPLPVDVVLWTACLADDSLFRRPLPPVGELLAASGLSHRGDHLAPAGVDLDQWYAQQLVSAIEDRHDLDEDAALAVLALLGLHAQFEDLLAGTGIGTVDGDEEVAVVEGLRVRATGSALMGGATGGDGELDDDELLALTLGFLEDPEVAEAFLLETRELGEAEAGLGLLAETLAPVAPAAARPALHWLEAKAIERSGDVLAAEAGFEAAVALDAQWPPALVDLARCASDRGDSARALTLLRRAGAGTGHPLVTVLEHFRPRPRNLGRNERCWCNSGRKYKHCHLGHEELPLEDRAAWLFVKAGQYVQDGPWEDELLEAAEALVAAATPSGVELDDAVYDPLVLDTVLVEAGAFEDFLDQRGPLLPDDERALGSAWVGIERSLYEVAKGGSAQGLGVHDLRTGRAHTVTGRLAGGARAGELLCSRVVPVGATEQFMGAVRLVDPRHRAALLDLLDDEPLAGEVVDALTRCAP